MADVSAPIVIELGKAKRKQLKQLRNGEGKLASELSDVLEQVRADLGPEADGKVLMPVVVIYRKKRKGGGALPLLGGRN